MWKRKGNIHLPALCLPNRGGYDTINLLQKGWTEDAADFDRYLIKTGYDDKIRVGEVEVNSGMTYEELTASLYKK